MEVIVKMKKREVRGEGGMCTKNGSYCEKEKVLGGRGGRGRCERRSEAFVKIQKKKIFFFLGGGSGWGVRVDVNGEVKLL